MDAMAVADDPAVAQLAAWRSGDDAAFAALVEAHQDAAFATAWCITRDHEVASDVMQEAFLRVLRHADRYDGRPFRPWLMEIVRHLAIDHLRTRRPHVDVQEFQPVTVPADLDAAADLRHRVAVVLGQIPEPYRQTLAMRELEDCSMEDIAREQGITGNLVRWRLHEARKRFRETWIRCHGEEY